MSEVKRYDSIGYDKLPAMMKEHPEGDYVCHEDYAALEAENERLKEEVRRWVIRIQQRGLEMDELSDERDTLRKQLDEARQLLICISATNPKWEPQISEWMMGSKGDE